jgi:hypothetical protein
MRARYPAQPNRRVGRFSLEATTGEDVGERETQLAETEVLFREVNEGIAAAAERLEAHEALFVCECSDVDCTHRIKAELDDYEEVRQEPTHFILAPGHEAAAFERVVQRRRGYWVVEKVEETMRRVVRRLNPRTTREPRPRGA